ncbi:Hypothetical predicted protein, partial [Mytilus galloprovincialis]
NTPVISRYSLQFDNMRNVKDRLNSIKKRPDYAVNYSDRYNVCYLIQDDMKNAQILKREKLVFETTSVMSPTILNFFDMFQQQFKMMADPKRRCDRQMSLAMSYPNPASEDRT